MSKGKEEKKLMTKEQTITYPYPGAAFIVTKAYLFLFGIYHGVHILSLLGIYETMRSAPSFLSLWTWHLLLLITYCIIPLLSIRGFWHRRGSQVLYSIVVLTCAAGVPVELFRVFRWALDFPILYESLAFLDLLAAVAACWLLTSYMQKCS